MVLEKNTAIINTICQVRIRSTDNVVDIPSLSQVYHTPSKIRYSASSSRTKNGNLHRKTLRLTYPGLSQEDFKKFDALIKGVYQVLVRMQNNEVYELASTQFPMSCTSSFNLEGGHDLTFNVSAPLDMKYLGVDESDLTGKSGSFLVDQFNYDFDFNLA